MNRYSRIALTLCAIAVSGAAVRSLGAQTTTVSFGAPTFLDLRGAEVTGHTVGDFNRDGHLDVMATITGITSGNVALATGDGAGRFALAPGFSFQDAGAATTADFNGDGIPDVAIAQNTASKGGSAYGDSICGSLVGIAIFSGPGMTSARCLATLPSPVAIQAGDFDRDGRPDLAVVSSSTAGLLIYRQLTVANATVLSVPGGALLATSMAPPADLNGDGLLDLVVGHATGVTVFLGRGDGTFAVAGTIASSDRVQAVAIGELDADGRPDIAFVQATAGSLVAAFGNGDGTFVSQPVAAIGSDLTDVAVADLNGDRLMDVIVAHRGGGTIRIFIGNGNGTFVAQTPFALGSRPKFLVVADLNGDGRLDLGALETGSAAATTRLWVALQDGAAPPDVIPPDVRLTAPLPGATLSSTVAIAASASDAGGIRGVDFYVGATLVGSDTVSPYSIAWNTTSIPNGTYSLTARAFDLAGNSATSPGVIVTVGNGGGTGTTPVELIASGGFEPTVNGWTRTGAAFFSTGGVQHTGVGYAYLAKANSVTGTVSQGIDIPAGSNPSLSFWLNVTSSEPSTTVASDMLFAEVLSSNGVLLQTLATYSNLDQGAPGAYVLRGGFSLAAYEGQKVQLQFRVVTDSVNATAFRIDDVSVRATVPSSPPPSGELIVSGGFEPTVTGWTRTGVAAFSTGGVQHTGTGYAYLAKANSVTGSIQQQITIPAGSAPSLSFWLNVTSAEATTTVPADKMFVEVVNSGGTVLATLATYSNLDSGPVGAYVLQRDFPLAAYAGQTIAIRFRAITDAVNVTAFRIDDVSVSASAPTPPPPADLIANGGFEPTVTSWMKSGTAFFSTGGVQHTGIGYAYLAKANSVTGTVSQAITIPAGTTPLLSFWINITSDEPSTAVASDKLFVEVLNASGVVLATLATYSNLDKGAVGAYVLRSGFSLAPYAGQSIRIQWRATTDALNPTAFRIDDVSVK